jgi:hypothetical protein
MQRRSLPSLKDCRRSSYSLKKHPLLKDVMWLVFVWRRSTASSSDAPCQALPLLLVLAYTSPETTYYGFIKSFDKLLSKCG